MKKGLLRLALVVLTVTAMLLGCVAQGEVAAPEGYPEDYWYVNGKAPDEISGKLTVWTWDPNFFTMIEKCNDVYPNIEFEFVNVASTDYILKLTTALASGGEVPDILCAEMNDVAKIYAMGICDDIAAYGVDKSLLVPYLAELGTNDDGTFVGIPNTAAPGGVVYRRDLAKEYFGTDDPEEIGKMMSDWDGFLEMAQTIKEKSGGKVSMLAGMDSNVQAWLNANTKPWVEDNKLLISENYQETFELVKRLVDADIDAGLSDGSPAYYASFSQGNVFCYFGANWTETFTIEPNDPEGAGNWAVCNAPCGPYNWGGIWWCMYNGSPNKDAVAAWKKYVLSPQGAQNKYELIHFYPGLQSAYTADYIYQPDEFLGGQIIADYYLKVMDEMTVKKCELEDGAFIETMKFYCKALENGEGTVEELLDAAEDDLISKIPTFTK